MRNRIRPRRMHGYRVGMYGMCIDCVMIINFKGKL